MSVKLIYFVHGTTTDNQEHKSTGQNPGVLSELGIQQSIDLKDQINMNSIDLVVSSDLQRAIDSANYTFAGIKEILHDSRLRECNYGDLNGANSELVVDEDHIDKPFPNGESLKDVEKRMRELCRFLLENYDGKTVALVAHKAPQHALNVIVNGETWQETLANDWRKRKAWQPGWTYYLTKA